MKDDFLSSLLLSISNPGELYEENLKAEKNGGLLTQLSTLLSPLIYSCVPLGVILWARLSFFSKCLLMVVIILQVYCYMLKGTNFGIFLVVFPLLIVKWLKKPVEAGVNHRSYKVVIFVTVLFVFYFVYNLSTRLGIDYVPNTLSGIPINKGSIIFLIFPPSIGFAITAASSYISQGYYGFSLGFNYDFTSTMGFGSGRFIIDKLAWIYDKDIWQYTYQSKMDNIWDASVQWHTAYLWLANDFGYWGVAMIMFIFGVLFSLVQRDATINKNPVSIILLSLYCIIILFIPANNIVAGNPTIFMSFVVLNMLFFLFNRVLIFK